MQSSALGPWSTKDFESMSWHDVNVHGFRLGAISPDQGTADLIFDIDYILKWDKTSNGFLFTVCVAELAFHDASDLKLMLDYATPTAGVCSFSIDGIERKPLEYPTGFKSFHWRIPINWPHGLIEFDAPGFAQRLVGKPVVQAMQSLSSEQREMS